MVQQLMGQFFRNGWHGIRLLLSLLPFADCGGRNASGAWGDTPFIRPPARNAAGDLGYQPDAHPTGAYGFRRAKHGSRQSRMAFRRHSGLCQSDIAVEPNSGAWLCHAGAVLHWLLLNKTRLGLRVRAVTQNRNMAACCGVPTGRVDMLAFGLGSGIAGLGGVALSQLGNVGPELGQSYIIDSFWWWYWAALDSLPGAWLRHLGWGSSIKFWSLRWGGSRQNHDPGVDHSVYSETTSGTFRAEREGY